MAEVLTPATFDDRIETREARLGTIGLGYAGLPLAMAFAEAGFDVTGIDLNEEAIAAHPYEPRDLRHYTGALTDIRPADATGYFQCDAKLDP